jgi:tetratricopeptide (TPR) repeat protein
VLHRRAAQAIEARAVGTPDFPLLYATLARHHVEAKSPHEAVRYLSLAGEQAVRNYANREAVAHLSAAVSLADDAGVDRLTRARWERRLAECSFALGDMEAVDEHVRRSLAHLGTRLPETRGQWAIQLLRELPVQVRHRFRGARVSLTEEDRDRNAEAAYALHQLAERAYYGFDALAMVAASLWSVNYAESGGVKVAQPYGMLGLTLGMSKLRGTARRYFELARDAAESTADDLGLGLTLIAESSWHLGEGSWIPARRLAEEAAAVARRTNDQKNLGKAETLRGHIAFYTGEFEESARIYTWLEDVGRKTYDEQHLAWGLYAKARALIPLGRLDQALVHLREAHAILERGAEAPSKIICPGLLAAAHLRKGELAAATEMADLCAARIRANVPSVFSTVAGYAAVAEVYLARLARGLPGALAKARWSIRQLALFAFSLPLGAPTHLRLRGELEALEGKKRRSIRSLGKAIAAAKRLHMPHEEALAHAALARTLAPGGEAQAAHRAAAETLLTKLRCSLDLDLVGDVFHGEAAVRRA